MPNVHCPYGAVRFLDFCYEILSVDPNTLSMYSGSEKTLCKGSKVAEINNYYLNKFLWNHIKETREGYFIAATHGQDKEVLEQF